MTSAGVQVPHRVGTMIEVPRAALQAGAIAATAEFFSFGTNDLTQVGARGGRVGDEDDTRRCGEGLMPPAGKCGQGCLAGRWLVGMSFYAARDVQREAPRVGSDLPVPSGMWACVRSCCTRCRHFRTLTLPSNPLPPSRIPCR